MSVEIIERTTITTPAGDKACTVWRRRDAEGRDQYSVTQSARDGMHMEPVDGWLETSDLAIELFQECFLDDLD